MFFTPPEKVYSYSIGCKVIAWLPFAATSLIALSTVLTDLWKLMQPAWMIALGISGALSTFFWLFFSRLVISVHNEGIACSGLFGAKEIRWEQVKETRYSQTMDSMGEPFTVVGIVSLIATSIKADHRATQNLKIVSGDGTKIRLNKYLRNHRELMRTVLSRVNPRLLNELRARVKQGIAADFGKLQLSGEGVRWGGKGPLPYQQIEMAGIRGQNFRIKAAGKWMNFVSVRASRVPNAFVAVDLIDEFKTGVTKSQPQQLSFATTI